MLDQLELDYSEVGHSTATHVAALIGNTVELTLIYPGPLEVAEGEIPKIILDPLIGSALSSSPRLSRSQDGKTAAIAGSNGQNNGQIPPGTVSQAEDQSNRGKQAGSNTYSRLRRSLSL